MKIKMGTVFSKVDGGRVSIDELRNRLSIPDYEKVALIKRQPWQKKIFGSNPRHIFVSPDGKFLSGHLDWLKSVCLDEEIEIDHNFSKLPYTYTELSGKVLRYYQKSAVENILSNDPIQGGIVRIPTRGGKTEIAISSVLSLDRPSLFLVNSKKLLHQTYKRYIDAGMSDVGRLGAGLHELSNSHTIATVQTLSRMLADNIVDAVDLVRSKDVMIFDECHHTSASTFSLVGTLCSASVRIGLSATPFKTFDRMSYEDLMLYGLVGKVVYTISAKTLYTQGYISEPHVYMVRYDAPRVSWDGANEESKNKRKSRSGAWRYIYNNGIIHNEARNHTIRDIVLYCTVRDYKTLVICNEINHGRNLLDLIGRSHYDTSFIHSGGVEGYRNQYDIDNGNFSVLIVSPVYKEGVDIPDVNAVVMASGGRSDIRTIQFAGRGLNAKEGENKTYIFDFYDDHNHTLRKQSWERRRIYDDNEYIINNFE